MAGREGEVQQSAGFDFSHLELRGVEEKIRAGEYVAAQELEHALRRNAAHPISPEVIDYVCRFILGEIKPPKGRKSVPAIERRMLHMLIRVSYQRYLRLFTKLKRRRGRDVVCGGEMRPPAEAAARLVAHRYYHGEHSWRRVQNIASSQK